MPSPITGAARTCCLSSYGEPHEQGCENEWSKPLHKPKTQEELDLIRQGWQATQAEKDGVPAHVVDTARATFERIEPSRYRAYGPVVQDRADAIIAVAVSEKIAADLAKGMELLARAEELTR